MALSGGPAGGKGSRSRLVHKGRIRRTRFAQTAFATKWYRRCGVDIDAFVINVAGVPLVSGHRPACEAAAVMAGKADVKRIIHNLMRSPSIASSTDWMIHIPLADHPTYGVRTFQV